MTPSDIFFNACLPMVEIAGVLCVFGVPTWIKKGIPGTSIPYRIYLFSATWPLDSATYRGSKSNVLLFRARPLFWCRC